MSRRVAQAFVPVLSLLLTSCAHDTTNAAARRMIVLGIDGMDPKFLEAHWESLPNLNRLRKEGDFRRLATTVPPQSPVAWSSVITGMDPGGHGIFDFIHRDPATRMPISSMSESLAPSRMLTIGPYLLPLSSGSVRTLRTGKAFWQAMSEHGMNSTIIRMPANFPAAECEAESLSGMGTPDMQGGRFFSFFTDDPAEKRTVVAGGHIAQIRVENGRAVLPIHGPQNGLRRDNAETTVDLVAHPDPAESVVRFETGDEQIVLKQGEWSEWLRASFPLIRGLKSARGMFRVYLQQVHPRLRVYVSPVNIDPQSPELPISTPASFSRKLNDAVGPFYTEGIPEETSAFRAGILTRAEFLQQSHRILADSLRMFRHELARFSGGLLFYYFSSVDQNAHMLWAQHDDELLDIYRGVDTAIGEAMAKAGSDTTLMIISDHGFARFDRAVHLNTWLMNEGFLKLDDPANTGDDEVFAHVDWSRTQAYALGLDSIYLNLENREPGGIVSILEKEKIADDISRRLLLFRDPKNNGSVVEKVYDPETTYKGHNLAHSPDLFVGFRPGYRASWQTALGVVPKTTIDDNTQAWIGDHIMAANEVPGVLLSNRKIRAVEPQLFDITATILSEFGVPKMDGMIGATVF